MSDGVSTAGFLPFGHITNVLNTGILDSGKAVSTYKSNLQAFLNFLNQTIITPVRDDNRGIGSNLALA
jgi:hypothetical protein